MDTKAHITLEIEETTILRQGPRILALRHTYERQDAHVNAAEANAFFRKLDEQGKCRITDDPDARDIRVD